MHWLVAKPKGKKILFQDSDSISSLKKIPREKIHAGERVPEGRSYRINKKEVILFERIST